MPLVILGHVRTSRSYLPHESKNQTGSSGLVIYNDTHSWPPLMRLTDHDERLAQAHKAEIRYQASADTGLAEMTELAERNSPEVTGPSCLRITAPKGHSHLLITKMPRMDERYRG